MFLQTCQKLYPIKCQCCPHIETSQLICTANQFTGFYMRATLTFNGINTVDQSTIHKKLRHRALNLEILSGLNGTSEDENILLDLLKKIYLISY